MKIKRIMSILIFFIVVLLGISFFYISSIFSNTPNFDENNVVETINQNNNLETNINYEIKTIKKTDKYIDYVINYPIFDNDEINNNIYNYIEETFNDFTNEFKDYKPVSENDKVYLNLEIDIGFFKDDLLFVRFFINRNYLNYPNPIKYYNTHIFNLKTAKEITVNEVFNDCSYVLFNKSKEYFKSNYGIKIDSNSENYSDIEPKMENYKNIFLKNKFCEFVVFDYKKLENVIIRINIDEIKPFIKEDINKDNSYSKVTTNIIQEKNNINSESLDLTEPKTETKNLLIETFSKTSYINNLHKSKQTILTNKLIETLENIKFIQTNSTKEENNIFIDPNKPMIALTFDDGPNNQVTNRILDILEKNNARATFFIVGRRLDKDAEILKRMDSLGNQIGNHTYNHKDLSKLSEEQITFEVEEINKKLEKYIGKTSNLVRVPYGVTNETVLNSVKYPIIMWNVDTKDWETRNTNATIEEIRKNAIDGNIILMHDLYETTADACEVIIPELINKGFQLVTIEEMMKYKNIELSTGTKYYSAKKK